MIKDKFLVMPLVAAAMFANLFLFAVSYSNASFGGYERELPSLGFNQLANNIDRTVAIVGENLNWTLAVTVEAAKPAVIAFLGLEHYKFGMPRYTVLPQQSSYAAAGDTGTGQVLGISIVNPLFER